MSSTVRCVINNTRVATGTPWGIAFLQVYPEQKTFASEAEWRSYMYQSLLSGIQFEKEDEVKVSVAEKEEDVKVSVAEKMGTPLSLNPKDWSHKERRTTTLPAGTYYIGDLCYALHDSLYEGVFGHDYDSGMYSMPENPSHVFWLDNTYGDGEFRGSDGKTYAVDAAILGIASESTLDPTKMPYDGGHMYTFKSPVKVGLKNNSFHFNGQDTSDPHISIPLDEEEDYVDSE